MLEQHGNRPNVVLIVFAVNVGVERDIVIDQFGHDVANLAVQVERVPARLDSLWRNVELRTARLCQDSCSFAYA